jgi:malonyl CoA-acyl carrier protein transacylase
VGGHSFGEVTALHVAGVLSEADLLHVARERGRAMSAAAAATPGAMAAVVATRERLVPLLERFGLDVRIANHNAPDQLVIAGRTDAIEEAKRRLAAEGLQVQPLNVATAFHSPVVEAATGPFREALAGVAFGAAQFPVYANTTAAPYPTDAHAQRDLLAGQIARPVRFVEMIQRMAADGIDTFVEVGPDAVLTRLVSRILEGTPHKAIATDRKGRDGVTQLLHALAQLGAAGVPLRLGALWEAYDRPATPPPPKVNGMLIPVQGNNIGKPYPPPPGAKVPPPFKPATPKSAVAIVPSVAPSIAAAVALPVAAAPAPAYVAPTPPVAPVKPVAATPVVSSPSAASTPDVQHAWLEAIERVQSRAVEAHASFQRTLVESHQSFLKSTEASLFGLAALAGQAPVVGFASPHVQPVAPTLPAFASPPALQPAPPAPVLARPQIAAPPVSVVSPPVLAAAPAPAPRVAPVPAPAAVAAAPARDLTSLLAAIVADKTGYPSEMLRPEMALEADLGIDSIKRVEILSAVREAVPELPPIDPKSLGTLQTLGEVAARLQSALGTAAPAPRSSVVAAPAPQAAAPARDVMAVLATVVAEKTGYPAEMLRPEMALEADLGIDSIKRVEILSAMREAVPELPQLDPKQLGTLQTLGEVADRLRSALGPVAPAAKPPAVSAASAPSAPARDVMAVLATVVAEKTGYPAEMLRPEMALEADLGIDSIKRVEILSAMREAVPELPQLDPKQLGTLQTLGEVADRLRSALGGAAKPPPQPAAAPAALVGVSSAAIPRLVVDWVPRAAPGLAMPGLFACKRIVILEDRRGVAAELSRGLVALGLSASLASSADAAADGLIDLRALDGAPDPARAIEALTLGFQLAHAIAPRFSEQGGAYVLVHPLADEQPWLAGLTALARTASLEWPRARVRAIACGGLDRSAAAVAEEILHELTHGGPDEEVSVGPSGRHVRRIESAPAAGGSGVTLGRGDVVVVSGGARGVTARCAIAMARAARGATFVLLGRSALADEPHALRGLDDAGLARALAPEAGSPAKLRERVAQIKATREVQATLAELRATSATVVYEAVDIADRAAVASALARVRAQHGPITAVVHGAGIIADKPIAQKTGDQVERVLSTKLAGLAALLEATATDPLRVLALFSSIAGRTGNIGQSDYAMANASLNAVAVAEHRRRGAGCVVKSIGWGPWAGGMVTPGLAAHFEKLGVPLIPLDAGADAFVAECFTASVDDVDVVLGVPTADRAPAAGQRPWEGTVVLHPSTHPYLRDHQLRGTVVVPVVMAMEWCARAAASLRPDLHVAGFEDVSVFRGIKLGAFDHGATLLRVVAEQISNGDGARVRVTVSDLGDHPHYRCEVLLADAVAGAPRREVATPAGSFRGAIYDGHALFHGPAFQVLDAIDGVDAEVASARLRGARFVEGWPDDAWQTDPAALDGALQLPLLWAREQLGGAMLPSRVRSVRHYLGGLATTPLRGVLTRRDVQPTRLVSDVALIDAEGRLFAELLGIETHLRPDDTGSVTVGAPARAAAPVDAAR